MHTFLVLAKIRALARNLLGGQTYSHKMQTTPDLCDLPYGKEETRLVVSTWPISFIWFFNQQTWRCPTRLGDIIVQHILDLLVQVFALV